VIYKWVLVIVGVLILGLGIGLYSYYILWMKMGSSQVANAEVALSTGITIDDAEDDFVIMGSNKEVPNENNPSPYRIPFLDVKSLTLGADAQYLYYKVTFFDLLPNQSPKVNSDHIRSTGCKLDLVDQSGKNYAILAVDFGWEPVIDLPALNTYYFYGPTGIQEPESARFSHQDHDSKIYGGNGTNYLLGAFPLKKLGLKLGQELRLNLSMEAKSDKYTHAAVDVLLGQGKMPATIVWKLGTNHYRIDSGV
jgi:hypothetical protein